MHVTVFLVLLLIQVTNRTIYFTLLLIPAVELFTVWILSYQQNYTMQLFILINCHKCLKCTWPEYFPRSYSICSVTVSGLFLHRANTIILKPSQSADETSLWSHDSSVSTSVLYIPIQHTYHIFTTYLAHTRCIHTWSCSLLLVLRNW